MKIFTALGTQFDRMCEWIVGEPSEDEENISPWLRGGMLTFVLFAVATGIPFWWIVDCIGAVFR